MRYRAFPLAVLLLSILLVGSCGLPDKAAPKPVTKQFPGGEPLALEEDSTQPAVPFRAEEETKPRKRIVIPGRVEERGLVLGAAVDNTTIPAGQPIQLRLRLRNTTYNAMPVIYSSALRWDAVAFTDPDQKDAVFQWSADRFFAEIYQDQMISPGALLAQIVEIPTTDDRLVQELMSEDLSRPLGPGTYYIYGIHVGRPNLAAGPVVVKVVPESDFDEAMKSRAADTGTTPTEATVSPTPVLIPPPRTP